MFSLVPLVLSQFLGYGFNTILTPSMVPTVNPGNVVVTAPYLGEKLQAGTVIGFSNLGTRTIHRIERVKTVGSDGTTEYVTRGDANNTPDIGTIRAEDIWGVAVNVIDGPLGDFIANFSWDADWSASVGKAFTSGDFPAVFALLPGIPWGAVLLLGFVLVFWLVIPNSLVRLGNRWVRQDEREREVILAAEDSADASLADDLSEDSRG